MCICPPHAHWIIYLARSYNLKGRIRENAQRIRQIGTPPLVGEEIRLVELADNLKITKVRALCGPYPEPFCMHVITAKV